MHKHELWLMLKRTREEYLVNTSISNPVEADDNARVFNDENFKSFIKNKYGISIDSWNFDIITVVDETKYSWWLLKYS